MRLSTVEKILDPDVIAVISGIAFIYQFGGLQGLLDFGMMSLVFLKLMVSIAITFYPIETAAAVIMLIIGIIKKYRY